MAGILPARKRPAHHPPLENGNRAIIIFLTVCTKDRVRCLASPGAFAAIVDGWRHATFWAVGKFMILPDHIHLFCAPRTMPPHPLGRWILFWRRLVDKGWEAKDELRWQKDFWDTQILSAKAYAEKWEYVRNNPVRHGLVDSAEKWPYQGELNVLPWHD